MNTVRKTVYNVYGTHTDLVKLYRKALKSGYSYGEIHPLEDDDPHMKICGRLRRRLEYDCPTKSNFSKVVVMPQVLLYRPYTTTIRTQGPFFELYKLTLTREY